MPDRMLFIHAYAPPYPGGTPIIVRRLLGSLSPDIELETVTDLALARRMRRGGPRLPGRYHVVPRVPGVAQRTRAGFTGRVEAR